MQDSLNINDKRAIRKSFVCLLLVMTDLTLISKEVFHYSLYKAHSEIFGASSASRLNLKIGISANETHKV
jgi:hypothetical protein